MPAKKAKPKAKSSAKTTATVRIPRIRTLITDSLRTLKSNPGLLVITGLVLVPSRFLAVKVAQSTAEALASGNLPLFSPDAIALFTLVCSILMNMALIWGVLELNAGRKPRVKDAYFKGTASFLAFINVALLLVLMLVPLIFAMKIVEAGILPAGSGAVEKVMLGIIAALLAAPTIYWLTRYVFSAIAVVESNSGPVAALKASGRLVRGRWFRVFKPLIVLAVLMSVVLSLPMIWFNFTKLTPDPWTVTIIQWVSGTIGLPFVTLYLAKLYKGLDGQKPSR